MDELIRATDQAIDDNRQEWITPVLVIEDVKEVTRGGTGPYPVVGLEEQTSAFYHS